MSDVVNPASIRRMAASLAGPRQKIETTFVNVGARLTDGAAMLNKLTRLFEALPAALQGADVAEASSHLSAVASTAAELSETFAQEKADLARLVEVVAAANSPIGELRRTVKMMGIVSVNARVTAAGIVGDSDDFDVFTTDIASLSDSASHTIQDFSQVYRQLTGEVDRAASQRARFESAHAHTLSGLANNLTQTLSALDEQRAAAVEGSAETSRVSRQIVGRIGSAVMALQVGDATRQRLEHVEAGLEALALLVEGQPALGVTLEDGEKAEAIAAIAALEQLQLAETASDFANEVGEADQSLEALASDADTIMASSRSLYGADAGKSSAIANLSAQLRVAVTILRDFETERAKLEAVASAVQNTVGVLLEHVGAVQDIEANMRLVSLNAAVRCAQLGPRGASLTVIASQLRELTTETVVAAENAMGRLNEASVLASAFGAAAAADGASKIGELEQQAMRALQLLTGLDQQLATALASLNTDGPKVIAALDAAARGISGQSALAEAMEDVGIEIASLSQDEPPAQLSSGPAGIIEALRKMYTMEAERAAHTRLFGGAAAASVPEAVPEDDLDAMMF